MCFVLTSHSVKAGNGGYLFAHMRHEDYGRLYYYISRDAKNWTKLNNNERVVPEYRGHPDIMKGRNGRYYMIGVSEKTQNPILWTSKDLVKWKQEKELSAEPFIHIEALDTFEFLKAQVGTGYYEELIRKYLLENTHGAIVLIKPEKGRTARMDKELQEKLQAYKESLTEQERKELVERSNALEAYQSAPYSVEDLENIPFLSREDISK